MATSLKGTIGGGEVTFSASAAVQKEKYFIITAGYHSDNSYHGDVIDTYWSCGFGTMFDNDSVKIGDITPKEIDGFKILSLQDQGIYSTDLEGNPLGGDDKSVCLLEANRKCILHIKGKDYILNHDTKGDGSIYADAGDPEEIGIEEDDKIKVTYTLL